MLRGAVGTWREAVATAGILKYYSFSKGTQEELIMREIRRSGEVRQSRNRAEANARNDAYDDPVCYVNPELNMNLDSHGNPLSHHEIHAEGCDLMPEDKLPIGFKSPGKVNLREYAKQTLDSFCAENGECGAHRLYQDIDFCECGSNCFG